MGLIVAVVSGAGAIASAAVVKVIADDAKEWTPCITRRLIGAAVRRVPEGQRKRYAEEWSAYLDQMPGVVAKLVLALDLQRAAFVAREMDARARLDAWQNEQNALVAALWARENDLLIWAEALPRLDEAESDTIKKRREEIEAAVLDFLKCDDEVYARTPTLGITVVGATFKVERSLAITKIRVWLIKRMARDRYNSLRDNFLKVLG